MNLFDRGYSVFKRLVLIDDKLERLSSDVKDLKADTTAMDRRLVRVETLVGIGLTLSPAQPQSPPAPPQLPTS